MAIELEKELEKDLKEFLNALQEHLKKKEEEIANKLNKDSYDESRLQNRRKDVMDFEKDVNFAIPALGDKPYVYQELIADFAEKAAKINAAISEIN